MMVGLEKKSQRRALFAERGRSILVLLIFVVAMFFSGSSVVGKEKVALPDGVVERLASEQFQERNQAYDQLFKWTQKHLEVAPKLLYDVWKKSEQPEVKTRCYELMRESVIAREFGQGKGFIGILMNTLGVLPKGIKNGISVAQVLPKTPGAKAGLKAGDLIIGVDKTDFNNLPAQKQNVEVMQLFQEYTKSKHPKDAIVLHLLRGEKKIDRKVVLGKRPEAVDHGFFDAGEERAKKRAECEAYFLKWMQEMGE